jgi:hypothetical protein
MYVNFGTEHKITLIKELRSAFGMSLKEAKDCVELGICFDSRDIHHSTDIMFFFSYASLMDTSLSMSCISTPSVAGMVAFNWCIKSEYKAGKIFEVSWQRPLAEPTEPTEPADQSAILAEIELLKKRVSALEMTPSAVEARRDAW